MTIPVNAGVNGELVAKAPRRITPQAVDDDVADPVGSRRVRQPSQKLLESSPNDKRPRLDDGPQNGQHGDDDPFVVERIPAKPGHHQGSPVQLLLEEHPELDHERVVVAVLSILRPIVQPRALVVGG